MARELTVDELTLLRGDTQGTKLYLAVFRPNTVYTALLNGVPASNDMVYEINFNGGAGTLSDVKPGMTLYVGTTAGAFDLGMCRIRKAPIAGTFYIGLVSDIEWADNCYLTVVDEFDLWSKHPVIDGDDLIMDVDVTYSDQHSKLSPVPVLGSHAVVWLDEATVDVEFDASDSWVLGSTITGYSWTAPGSSASSGMTSATPTITYNAPGIYRVLCTVTAANAKTTTGVRHVFVYDRSENMPATVFQLGQNQGDHDSGGWMFDLSMQAEASLSELRDRSLVILFAEDWYGSSKQSIGPVANRENIVCVGRVVGESLRWDREAGLVHFTVQGLQYWLNKIKTFPVELHWVGFPGAWDELAALTVDKALYHILYWHSTVIETMDFYRTEDALYATDAKALGSTIWTQLIDVAYTRLMAMPGVNRWGQLFVEIDPQMVPEADRDFPEVMEITSIDWQEALDFQRRTVPDVSLISLACQVVNASGGSVTRYSLSPGHVPARYGEPEPPIAQMLAASQSASNQKAGLLFGWRTNPYPDIPISLAMNNRALDLYPRQYYNFAVTEQDTPRGVTFSGRLIPRRISFTYDADAGFLRPDASFEAETFERVSADGDVPESEDQDFSLPPLPDLPDLPDLPLPLPGPGSETESGPPKVLINDRGTLGNNGLGLCYSENFNTPFPNWRQVNAGLTPAQYQSINRVVPCPNGALYVAGLDASTQFLARAPYIGGTFEIIEDQASINAKLGVMSGGRIAQVSCDGISGERVVYVLYEVSTRWKFYMGSGSTFVEKMTLSPADSVVGELSYGNGAWVWTSWDGSFSGHWWRLNSGCTASVADGDLPSYEMNRHKRVLNTGNIFHYLNHVDTSISKSTGNMASLIDNVGSGYAINNTQRDESAFAIDPTATYLMAPARRKSSDGGASSVDIGSLPVSGTPYYFAYAGGAGVDSRWIAGAVYLYYSEDFGVSWDDKQGDLASLNPFFAINAIKVVEF
jgi:hypothetical protein